MIEAFVNAPVVVLVGLIAFGYNFIKFQNKLKRDYRLTP